MMPYREELSAGPRLAALWLSRRLFEDIKLLLLPLLLPLVAGRVVLAPALSWSRKICEEVVYGKNRDE